jgi:hypothetical protein
MPEHDGIRHTLTEAWRFGIDAAAVSAMIGPERWAHLVRNAEAREAKAARKPRREQRITDHLRRNAEAREAKARNRAEDRLHREETER